MIGNTRHILIETIGCGEFAVPKEHITLHRLGNKYRILIKGDEEWREITCSVYLMVATLLSP